VPHRGTGQPQRAQERHRARIEAAGSHRVFLPTYAPDLNPIEPAFATTKQALRRVGPGSSETAVTAVAMVLPIIIAADARAFFADACFPVWCRKQGTPLQGANLLRITTE
jgi:transposase